MEGSISKLELNKDLVGSVLELDTEILSLEERLYKAPTSDEAIMLSRQIEDMARQRNQLEATLDDEARVELNKFRTLKEE